MQTEVAPYLSKNKIRVVTAASLFDGHDAAINIMRRIMQASGCEVIHLGHNRSVAEIVNCAIEEDAQAIAITSYQGGHVEYLKYMYDMLQTKNSAHIKIFAGGGGVILPTEIEELQHYGIARIYSPDDGRKMGLQGMINDMLEKCDFPTGNQKTFKLENLKTCGHQTIAQLISCAENFADDNQAIFDRIRTMAQSSKTPVLGITGTGGAGKSSLVDELVNRFLTDFENKQVAIISVDPSKRKTGGALLGDRIRMNAINSDRVYMRSLATRQSNLALSKYVQSAIEIVKAANFDLIILETSGIGQSDTEITDHSNLSLYVMTPEYGASSQLEKIDMLDFADIIAINKFDKRGAEDALRDVTKQYKRNHKIFDHGPGTDSKVPIFGTIASQFNDPGMNHLYQEVISQLNSKLKIGLTSQFTLTSGMSEKKYIIPPKKTRYLAEIVETIRAHQNWIAEQCDLAETTQSLSTALATLSKNDNAATQSLENKYQNLSERQDPVCKKIISGWPTKISQYKNDFYSYCVRDKEIKIKTYTESLSKTKIPKIAMPKYRSHADILRWSLNENVPGEYPFTAGVFPFKREGEDPTRMFAGEGGPERTNRRFHYLSCGLPATRLSTAFDSVTLYGEDPNRRPDIYGKIGNSGVSICCLDDAKKLYSGFRLTDAKTSVSMTINGPSAIMVGYFMNAAIDQECEIYINQQGLENSVRKKIKEIYEKKYIAQHLTLPSYQGPLPEGNDGLGLMLLGVSGDQVLPSDIYEKIKLDTISKVRGTVQADILKEDQGQNTCIFSTEFALKIMGDIQEYFINNNVRNFYSVSISGYHIAEAGANPITQLALTLSNGFTFVEYYLSRGMDIDAFAPNLSFFFSNGIDPEYAVIGRVARRIWARAMKLKYGGNSRSQMLKYHIQTSGRSLHAQEIDFNDIRTTLQALYAIYDNCNSLHTNAYDEAITTPTEESVRRAMAIQLIINSELGLAKNQNAMQGSFIIEELTDLVEEAVLSEFEKISERGGVLGAMETMYQRSKIQEESLYYETLKHTGEYPIIGVNTFLSSKGSPTIIPREVIRATTEEKENQITTVERCHTANAQLAKQLLQELHMVARDNKNIFEKLMEVSKYCSIGQITNSLYHVGGQYRRNM
ncbi:MAG: methylmalonyl-CoA mutase [Bdellovibrionales bacterium RIFOXYD12_FULL_39_22]|nr:MAG: methylmalonyl-CoA mutase [Bdellovibrionales bacterium RIFOXYB1_FULL_39_21]OFZ42867.1 MAG: methylmalonyl-CoA mutase [Bdellovibrionales bacterium RIFOXYC12_FULL_39_17]OFZ47473.1 MAG: methylmalonyl-CoA mutase [Bdellovibrionales bacterium RIFOXYC1_FULL_39_130]OFZ71622.1 MAG: methylmalonyl-CoA mutase [Bdellovibrionales bacterium RIFOXYC2_FULL_39_8]OFZ75561.1 MAG: methylmalonyl-CoA mutase [Bdellovibrionales bacterium RIFOXYD1_FULL_39_84]OFZ93884.1 MAG: methylmalonyl-CoA mutase [Bdellovibrion